MDQSVRFKALGHPLRLKIALRLAQEPGGTCACDFAEIFGVSQPTVSEHMRVLTAAKLVRAKRIKQWTMYRRNEAAIDAVKRAIEEKV